MNYLYNVINNMTPLDIAGVIIDAVQTVWIAVLTFLILRTQRESQRRGEVLLKLLVAMRDKAHEQERGNTPDNLSESDLRSVLGLPDRHDDT